MSLVSNFHIVEADYKKNEAKWNASHEFDDLKSEISAKASIARVVCFGFADLHITTDQLAAVMSIICQTSEHTNFV